MNRKDAAKLKKELNKKKLVEISFSPYKKGGDIIITDDIDFMDYDSLCIMYVDKVIDANADDSKPIKLIKTLFPKTEKVICYAMELDNSYEADGDELIAAGWDIMRQTEWHTILNGSCKYIIGLDKDENFKFDENAIVDGLTICL